MRKPGGGRRAGTHVYNGTRALRATQQAEGSVIVNEEIEPYVLYRVDGPQVECALWQLQQGEKALALFLSGDAALSYSAAAQLAGWEVLRPDRPALLELLQAYVQAGVKYAVLDPDLQQAKRIFDLRAILDAARAAPPAD